MGFSVQDEDYSSEGGALAVHALKDTVRVRGPAGGKARVGSRSVRRYLHDAETILPGFTSEATKELASLHRLLLDALLVRGAASWCGLPTDGLLNAMRPVFERWYGLSEIVLAIIAVPNKDTMPMMDALLDAVSVDDLYAALSGSPMCLGFAERSPEFLSGTRSASPKKQEE